MNPDEKKIQLAEERTELARERTELAEERTILSDMRTGATFILFGITFLGLATESGAAFLYIGITTMIFGTIMLINSMVQRAKNQKEIKAIQERIKNHRNNIKE